MVYTSTRRSAKSSAKYVYCVPDPQMHGPHGPTCKHTDGHTDGRMDTQKHGRTHRSTDGHTDGRTDTQKHGRRLRRTDADASARWCMDAKYSCVQCVGGKSSRCVLRLDERARTFEIYYIYHICDRLYIYQGNYSRYFLELLFYILC